PLPDLSRVGVRTFRGSMCFNPDMKIAVRANGGSNGGEVRLRKLAGNCVTRYGDDNTARRIEHLVRTRQSREQALAVVGRLRLLLKLARVYLNWCSTRLCDGRRILRLRRC